jgi:peptidoglycan/LPS O-acetylase OafA/YrhL
MPAKGKDSIIAIDLLRFACAVLVMAYHYGIAFWLTRSPHAALVLGGIEGPATGGPLAAVGWIGVELFFVISGLVIARSALGAGAPGFLVKRALRLVPAVWICATITALALAATGRFGGSLGDDWLRSMIFWPAGDQIDASYWTLGIEVAFYGVVALAIGRGGTPDRLDRVAVILGAASGAFWLWCWWTGQGAGPIPANRYTMLMLLPHGCFFAIGIVIAAIGERRSAARAVVLALLTAVGLYEVAMHAADRVAATGLAMPFPLAGGLLVGGIAVLLGAGKLQPRLARWIPAHRARMIGLMTYPLYLLHQDAGAVIVGALMTRGVPADAAMAAAAIASVTLAWLVASAAEPAVRRALRANPLKAAHSPS